MKDINFALVEEKRPPMYKAMKYWGKKPHNIWRQYIENYTPLHGEYLDPFTGSAVSAFESVKAGRKVTAFDLNPLTSFIIEVFSLKFDLIKFKSAVDNIFQIISENKIYQEYFTTICPRCGNRMIIQNYKWDNKIIYEVGIVCKYCKIRSLVKPTSQIVNISTKMNSIQINKFYPNKEFYESPSFQAMLIKNLGGNNFNNLWTRRNLFVLSEIFDIILKQKDETIKKQLLYGFIQTVHLCTKMCVPRREDANRPFSTSWGRSAYLCSSRQMEMNPLLVFYGSCLGKQSVKSALSNVESYLGKIPKVLYVDKSNKSSRTKSYDIKYGIIDVNTITDYIDEKSIDFIMTDPPYGGLVQYLDLSTLWLIWLERYDKKYTPNYDAEITIKPGIQNINTYQKRFEHALKNLFKILKDDGKIIFTFHNKRLDIWNAFLSAVQLAGFKIEKVIHQQNKRTGESNVANPYGTSATDFYIRCIKSPITNLKTDKDEFEQFVVTKAIQIIGQRNEPTPYQILYNGILAEISSAGFMLEDFDQNVNQILEKHLGTIFKLEENNLTKSGDFWWFLNPEEHIKYPDKLLSDRVEETILSLLRRKVSVTFDEVLGEIFVKYPNGLTPDIKSIEVLLKKFANKSGGKWKYKGGEIEAQFTKHTDIIQKISLIGKKAGYKIYIGKREQPERFNQDKKLSDFADFIELPKIGYNNLQKSRLEMVDIIWIKDNNPVVAFEVENSTNFTSGIQRASNFSENIPKLMIIPDVRKKEFNSIKDPLFIDGFYKYNWKYIYYSEIERIISLRNPKLDDLIMIGKVIK